MSDEKPTKSIKLRGPALAAARTYDDLLESARTEYQEEHDKAVRELRTLQAKHLTGLQQAWCVMAKHVFPKEVVEETWQNSNYRLDITYLDEHQIAFINVYNGEIKETAPVPGLGNMPMSGGGSVH